VHQHKLSLKKFHIQNRITFDEKWHNFGLKKFLLKLSRKEEKEKI